MILRMSGKQERPFLIMSRDFNLLRGDSTDEYTLYSSHSIWQSKEHFIAWTKSEAFRKAHRNAGENKPLYIGHPEFEGFNVVL